MIRSLLSCASVFALLAPSMALAAPKAFPALAESPLIHLAYFHRGAAIVAPAACSYTGFVGRDGCASTTVSATATFSGNGYSTPATVALTGTTGLVYEGMQINGTSVVNKPIIIGQLSGTGGDGTYYISWPQSSSANGSITLTSGAATAGNYTTQHSNFLTSYANVAPDGSFYTFNATAVGAITFNAPGKDYPVGPAASTLLDASVQGNVPSTCTAAADGRTYCLNDSNGGLLIDGLDFTKATNKTFLQVNNTVYGPCVIRNSKFGFSQSNTYMTSGHTLMQINGCSMLAFYSNIVDGLPTSWTPQGQALAEYAPPSSTGAAPQLYLGGNVLTHSPSRWFSYNGYGDVIAQWNYMEGQDYQSGLHGDGILVAFNGHTQGKHVERFNIIYVPGDNVYNGSTGLVTPLINGNTPFTGNITSNYLASNVSLNVGDYAQASSLPATANGTSISASVAVGNCSGSPSYCYSITPSQSNNAGTAFYTVPAAAITNTDIEENIIVVSSTNAANSQTVNLTGALSAGVLGTNTQVTIGAVGASLFGAGITNVTRLTGTTSGCGYTYCYTTSRSQTIAAEQMYVTYVTAAAAINLLYAEYNGVTIKNNFIWPLGANECINQNAPFMTTTPAISGNYNLFDGSVLTGFDTPHCNGTMY